MTKKQVPFKEHRSTKKLGTTGLLEKFWKCMHIKPGGLDLSKIGSKPVEIFSTVEIDFKKCQDQESQLRSQQKSRF